MKRCMATVLGVLAVGLLAGCENQTTWVYAPNSYCECGTTGAKSVVVLPFDDCRENVNKNRSAMSMIPIVPAYGWVDYSIPEGQIHMTSRFWANYRPADDFARALAQELNAAKICEAAFDNRPGACNVMIKGKILSTFYHGTIITYGLSGFGELLWLIGFPAGSVSNDLSIELTCVDGKTDAVLFSKRYDAPHYGKVFWIYAKANDFEYPALLRQIYKQFVSDAGKALQ
jgi:hypothetical protein